MGEHCWIVAGMPAEQKQLIRASQIAAHKMPSAPESPLSLCYVTDWERRGEWDCACAQNMEHLLFRSMWETYFCVRFESRNGRLKQLQSFWYTLDVVFQNLLLYVIWKYFQVNLSDLCYCWRHIDTWYSSALLLVLYSPQHILCTVLLWSKHVHFGSAWHNTRP